MIKTNPSKLLPKNPRLEKISNKPHKLDYETIKNIVGDNSTNIRTSQRHMSNKPQRLLK